jgi:hypothetical protein
MTKIEKGLAAEEGFGEGAAFGGHEGAWGDVVPLKPALIDFENVLHLVGTGGDAGFIAGLHVVQFEDGAVRIDVSAGEREEGIAHPELGAMRLWENEEHSFHFGHVGAPHHAGHDLGHGQGDFGSEFIGAEPELDGGEAGLRAAGVGARNFLQRSSGRSGDVARDDGLRLGCGAILLAAAGEEGGSAERKHKLHWGENRGFGVGFKFFVVGRLWVGAVRSGEKE